MLGGWLRQQALRPGPLGGAAGAAVTVVNRSASLMCEVSAEVARATAREVAAKGNRNRAKPSARTGKSTGKVATGKGRTPGG